MLALLSLLQTHRYWPGTELAQRLEVSERTLRRDVERLRDLGYPVNASRGVAGGYQLQAGAALPPLLLDDEEAVAIAVGLRTAAAGAVDGIEETSVRALTKVIQVMPPKLRRRVDALRAYTVPAFMGGGGPSVDATALTVIAQCCRDDERLRFDYTTRDGTRAVRVVEPHRLVPLGRRWYLVAWDTDRADWRTFRVDRLTPRTPTGPRFTPRTLPGGDVTAFVAQRFAGTGWPCTGEAVLHAPADSITAWSGAQSVVEPLGPDRCRVVSGSWSWGGLAAYLGMFGCEVEIVGPGELREAARELSARFARAAGG